MAAFFGRVAEVTAFLENNPESVDDVSEGDRPATMLQTAALANMVRPGTSLEIIRLLLSRGADVNRRGGPGTSPTALHELCLASWRDGVAFLIQAGADVNMVCGGQRGDRPPTLAMSMAFSAHWLVLGGEHAERTGRTIEQVLHDQYQIMQLLLRAGHPLDFPVNGNARSLESVIEDLIPRYTGDAPYLTDALELARTVRACLATSASTRLTDWQKYCLVPPKELLRLRSQIARGKAVVTRSTPPHLARLFARSLPNEIAWRVLAFWTPRH